MSRTEFKTVQLIRTILTEHDNFWDAQRAELRRYKNVYENKYWSGKSFSDGMLRIETADGRSFIERYMSSLFSREPAVEIGNDEASRGDAELAESLANRFLVGQRRHIENCTRLALMYPCSFLKLAPTQSSSLLDKIAIRAVNCWEVIVDRDATSWDEQRFTGHVYYISIPEARERFGAKDFSGIQKVDYFNPQQKQRSNRKGPELPEEYLYIQVVELYDMLYDSLYFWSPQYQNGMKLIDKGDIPVRTFDDKPLAPIVPVYYCRIPDAPLIGIAMMSSIYDQISEKNNLRTYMANAVRRDSRQWIYKEGKIDEEALAKISAGQDGAMIAVDGSAVDAEGLAGLIIPVPNTPISSDHDRYLAYIEQDIARGSIASSFSGGAPTNATATEITALAQYDASDIGKFARDRDEMIERVAMIYLRILSFNAEEGDKAVIIVDGVAKVVTPDDLDAKFRIAALDQGYQPLSDAIKKQNLIQLLPTLTALGTPNQVILDEIVRTWELPESFKVVTPVPTKPVGPNTIPNVGDVNAGTEEQVSDSQELADSLIQTNS